MKQSSLALLALIFFLLLACVPSPPPTPPPVSSIPIRGMRADFGREQDSKFVALLRKMNANWVQLTLWPQVTQDMRLIEHFKGTNEPGYSPQSVDRVLQESLETEERLVAVIKKWHSLGFKVFLLVYHERLGDHHAYGYGLKGDMDEFLRQAKEIAVKWARIAEENRVEMYAPRKELQLFVGPKKALEWDRDILPEVRAAYSGILVQGVPFLYEWDRTSKMVYRQEQVPVDVSGYDYLGVDFYGSDVDTFEELEAFYAKFLIETQELKAKFGLKGVTFLELGEPHSGRETFWNDPSLSADEVFSRFLDIFYRLGVGRIDGFFPWLLGAEGNGVVDLPAGRREYIEPTKVISRYYTSPVTPAPDIERIAAREAIPLHIDWQVSATLLREEFNDAHRWDIWGSDVHVTGGVLEVRAGGARLNEPSSAEWGDYVFRGKFKPIDGEVSFIFRDSSPGNYAVMIKPISILHLLKFSRVGQKEHMDVPRGLFPLVEFNKWHSFTIYCKGNAIQILVDDEKVTDYRDEAPVLRGTIALQATGHTLFDDISLDKLTTHQ